MRTRAAVTAVLAIISAFSAFPSPFYADIAAASSWAMWASAALFSIHGVGVIAAMTVVRRSAGFARLACRDLVVAALVADALGGLLLALGMGMASVPLLLAGRLVTGVALGLVTPVLTETLARETRSTSWATAATLGGVGVGALMAALLATAGVAVPLVFVAGTAVLAAAGLGAARIPGIAWSAATTTVSGPEALAAPGAVAAPSASAGPDVAATAAVLIVFAANGVLGLFTSLVPAAVAPLLGGGSLLAGLVVATTMIGAGLSRLVAAPPQARATAITAAVALSLGAAVFAAGVAGGRPPAAVVLGSALIGAACGIGHDAGLRMAIGPKVDALRKVRGLARVQRAGQLGLVIPALVFPALART